MGGRVGEGGVLLRGAEGRREGRESPKVKGSRINTDN